MATDGMKIVKRVETILMNEAVSQKWFTAFPFPKGCLLSCGE